MQQLKRILLILLIGMLYLKFMVQIIYDQSSLILDLMLYGGVLLSWVDTRVRPEFFLLFIFAAISVLNPASKNIFLIFSMVYVLRDFKIREIASINFCMQVVLFITICFLLWGGSLKPEMFEQTFFDQRERWDFGFGNPNTFALFIYSMMINLYILTVGRHPKVVRWIMFAVSVWVYSYTMSRTFLLSSLLLLLVSWTVQNKRMQSMILVHRMPLYFLPIIFLFCIIFLARYSEQLPLLDLAFSGRLNLYNTFVSSVPSSGYLIGTPLINENTIDSSYLHILFEGGVIAFIVFYYLYYITIKRMDKANIFILPILISFLAYGLAESIFTFLLIFGNMLVWSIMYQSYYKKQNSLG